MGKRSGRFQRQKDVKQSKQNLFEAKFGSKKVDVLGKRPKHDSDKPRNRWSQGIEKRKGTLLVEYKLRNKANSFVDRRIGEHDSTLSEDDKAIARFQRQRFKEMIAEQSTHGVRDEEPLFRMGRMERREDQAAMFADSDAAEPDEQDDILPSAPFGGFIRKETADDEPTVDEFPKSKKQVMEEVIAKSKAFKAEKAKQRDADLDETEALDRDLNILLQDGLLQNLYKKKGTDSGQHSLIQEELKYDKDRRGLIYEAKAKAGTKVETQQNEEAHQDDVDQLEPSKMPGTSINALELAPGEEGLPKGGYALRRAKLRQRQEAQDKMDAGEYEEEEDEKDSENEASYPSDPEESENEVAGSGQSPVQDQAAAAGEELRAQRQEADSAFPDTYDVYILRTAKLQPEEMDSVLHALRSAVRNSAADEGRRLQMLCGYMIQHFADRAGATSLPLEELDVLARHIVELSTEVPLYAVSAAQARLSRLQQRLSDTLTVRKGSKAETREVGWPSQRQLLILKLLATVFTSSERRHHVLTPMALIIAAYLKLCPVTSQQDVKAGLFLSSLGLNIMASSGRIMPEPLVFACNVVRHASGSSPHCELGSFGQLALWSSTSQGTGHPATSLLSLTEEQQWPSLLSAAIIVIGRLSEVFSSTESFPELFNPALHLLKELGSRHLPKDVDTFRQQVCARLTQRMQDLEKSRRPVQKEKAVKEVKQFNPRFEEEFAVGKNYDPDRDRAEARKLKRKLAKEQRSAVRELRKDAVFLGGEVEKERQAQDQQLRSTIKKNTAWLQSQEADFRSGGQGGLWKKQKRSM